MADFGDFNYSVTVREGQTYSYTFPLDLSLYDSFTISWSTVDGTARVADGDYLAASGKGISGQVTILDDGVSDPGETFKVVASFRGVFTDPSDGHQEIDTGRAIATLTITERPPPVLAISDAIVDEDAGTATFKVTRTGSTSAESTVSYSVQGGTATAGLDFDAVSGVLTFAPGVTTRFITVPILDDGRAETAETFTVSLASPTNATIGDGVGIGTILGNDGAVLPKGWIATSSPPGVRSPSVAFDSLGRFVVQAKPLARHEAVEYLSDKAKDAVTNLLGGPAGQFLDVLESIADFDETLKDFTSKILNHSFRGMQDIVGQRYDPERYYEELDAVAVPAMESWLAKIADALGSDSEVYKEARRLQTRIELLQVDPASGTGSLQLSAGLPPPTVGGGFNQVSGKDSTEWVFAPRGLDNKVDALGGHDVVASGSGNDRLDGGSGNDILCSGDGADAVAGGTGRDVLIGGAGGGDDTYDGGSGIDTITFSSTTAGVTVDLSAGADQATGSEIGIDQIADVENVVGGAGSDSITGNAADNVLRGGAGSDTLAGGGGNDRLDGGSSFDQMSGGAGDDTFVVDANPINPFAPRDVVLEGQDGGTDTIISMVGGLMLPDHVEKLILDEGAGAVSGTGNGLDNVITGNSFGNSLSGGAGNDTLKGGRGNDSYVVDSAGDRVVELAGQGADTVNSMVSYVLPANVESLALLGSDPINGTGNAHANTVWGNAAANTLKGGEGIDTVSYEAAAAGVTVSLALAGPQDTVGAGIDTLSGFENLSGSAHDDILTGSAAANWLRGGIGSDSLAGGGGNDVLVGGSGADTMAGGTGNDIYVVEDLGDTVSELPGQGIDTVQSFFSFDLGTSGLNVENLTLLGGTQVVFPPPPMTFAIGNALANVISGNAAANMLSGGAGDGKADTLRGGDGDDIYVVEAGDVVIELAGQGTDTVRTAGTYALGANVENLELQGTADIEGRGNALANAIVGNSGNNRLNGKGGNDTLTGGPGGDVFFFGTALDASANLDRILDFETTADRVALDDAIFTKLGGPGALLPGFFHVGAIAADLDDYIVYDDTSGALFYDSNGSKTGGQVQFASLDGAPVLSAGSFTVV